MDSKAFFSQINPTNEASLNQLIHFITHQPYAIHHITKTETLTKLIQQLTTTTTTHTKLTIDALIIILPRVASLIRTYLPFLFIALGKTLLLLLSSSTSQHPATNPLHLSHSILNLFNLLYGIAPCNLIEFLRNPTHHTLSLTTDPPHDQVLGYELLEQSIQPEDLQDMLPVEKLQAMVAPMMHRHRLNKNLILMTAVSERKEISNRLKMYEPADLIERCERHLIQDPAEPEHWEDPLLLGQPTTTMIINETKPQQEEESPPTQLSLSSPVHNRLHLAPALPIVYPKFDLPVSEPPPEEALDPQPPSFSSNHDDSPAQDHSLPTSSDARLEELETENRMLKTQLHLELYLKSQHLQQLGSVHKQNILDAGLEAENQNLLRMNRELRKKLAKNEESKQESQSAKMMTIKNKLAYQDLIKKKNLELKKDNLNFLNAKFVLQNQINELEKVVEVQNRNLLLVQSEAHELRNQLTLIEPTLRKLSGLESTTEALSRALLTWDDDLRRFRESRSQITRLMGQWKLSESMAASSEETNGGLRAAVQSLQATVERLTTENQLLRARAQAPSPDALRAAALRADHLAARLQRTHEVNARLRAALVGLDSDPLAQPLLQDHLSDDPAEP